MARGVTLRPFQKHPFLARRRCTWRTDRGPPRRALTDEGGIRPDLVLIASTTSPVAP